MVPVFVIVSAWANAVPGIMAPSILIFAVPAKVKIAALVLWERLRPPSTRVLPTPFAVRVRADKVLVMFALPMVSVVLVPAKVIIRESDTLTLPLPRFRLFAEVLFAFPNVNPSLSVQDWFPRLVIAAPLVLLIVVLADKVSAPVPSALALLILRVPAVRVTPPAAPELLPERVSVPAAALMVVRPP